VDDLNLKQEQQQQILEQQKQQLEKLAQRIEKLESDRRMKALTTLEFEDVISRFDEWFRYVEEVGQQRLQNYLQTGSILLVACAALLTVPNRALLSLPFSIFGFLLSLLWYVKGTRQSKFHQMIDNELGELLKDHPCKKNFPIYYVREMKSKKSTISDEKLRLNAAEQWLSTRKFLWLVPCIFSLAYLFCIIFAFFV
jgi:hypothetical protein